MSKLPLTLSTLLLASCTTGPVATQKGVWMGGTALTRTEGYYARYDGPYGKIEVGTAKTDETVVPGKLINYYGTKAITNGMVDALKTTEGTKQVLSGHDVAKEGIKATKEVESLKILHPVEVPPIAAP